MIGGGRRQMLLVLALIVGVVGMHALVVLPAAPVAGDRMPPSVAIASDAAPDGPAQGSVGAHHAMANAPAAGPAVGPVTDHSGHSDPSGRGGGHGSMPSSMHHVLHLCVAILAGLMVLGMAVLALWPTQRPDQRGVSIGALVRRAPRRPPATSVRLAQLCVLRN